MRWMKRWLTIPLAALLVFTGISGAVPSNGTATAAGSAAGSETNSFLANQIVSANILSKDDIPDFAGIHPRMYVPLGGLEELRERVLTNPEFAPEWRLVQDNSSHALSKAFQYMITGDAELGNEAVNQILTTLKGMNDSSVAGIGRTFLSTFTWAPMIYDWCYDLMSEEQKYEFKEQLKRAVKDGHPGYPINRGSLTIVGHDVEGWFWNQFLIGLAIYDEEPKMWDDALDFFFSQHQIVRNFYFPSGLHHQGWYIGTRFAHVSNFNLLMHQLTGGHVFDSSAQQVPYQLISYLRPDGEQLRSADVGGDSSGSQEFKALMLENTANLYHDEYLNFAKRYFSGRDPLYDAIINLLTRPEGLGEKPLDTLPLVKYHPEPVGAEMLARSGWDISGPRSDDFLVQMRIGQYYFGNHQHMDMGTFQIYYKGNLTGDSGVYRGTKTDANSQHDIHYYRMPVAHNSLIIYNPDQIGGTLPYDPKADGGIVLPRQSGTNQPRQIDQLTDPRNTFAVSDVTAQGTDEHNGQYNYAYIAGDLTKGFTHTFDNDNPARAERVTRSMVTMPTDEADHPLAFFVFDRMRATDESYLKKFVMHFAEDPTIEGNRVQTSAPRSQMGYDGELVSWSLLPKNPVFEVVEGYKTGYGANEQEYDPGIPEGGDVFESMIHRLEVSSSESGLEEHFLHAMTVSEDGTPVTVEAELIENGNVVGAKLFNKNVLFSKNGMLETEVEFGLSGEGTQGVLVTDLAEGHYVVDRTDLPVGSFLKYAEVDPDCRCLYFEGNAGDYVVTRTSMTEEIVQRHIAKSAGDTTAPTVELSAVQNGAVLSGNVELAANAADNAGVAGVQWMLNKHHLGAELTTAPYEMTWNTADWPDGTYRLSAVARDAAGHKAVSSEITVRLHNEPGFLPVMESFKADDEDRFETLSGGTWSLHEGYYELTAPASGTPHGNAAVHKQSIDAGDDYRLDLVASVFAVPNGEREFSILFDVQDEENYYYATLSEDATKSGIYKNANGNVSLLAGLNQAIIPGGKNTVRIDRIGPYTDVYFNNKFIGQARDSDYDGGKFGIGAEKDPARLYSIKATPLIDAVQRDLQSPQVSLVTPEGGATVNGEVIVEAVATDNDKVDSVQFQLNGINLGKRVFAQHAADTYRLVWDSTTRVDGAYSLTAIARDATGNVKTSAPVPVTIDNGSGAVLINEDFSSGADRFEVMAGGVWQVVNEQYHLSTAVNVANIPNNNISVHETPVDGSFMISVDAGSMVAGGTKDFSVIFNYQDNRNYHYVNFSQNANPDPLNNGIFRYQNGVMTELANINESVMGGVMHNITVRRNGVQIGAYVNGVLVAFATDAAFMEGKIGLGSRNDTTIFDNLLVIESDFEIEDNILPEVSMLLPADGSTVNHKVNVRADATDNVAITDVQFYLNGEPLGPSDVLAPYDAEWDTRDYADGSYLLEAVATDIAGNVAKDSITVTVDNSNPAAFPKIAEFFTYEADRFTIVYPHATQGVNNWKVYNGGYELNPVNPAGTEPNSNIAIHNTKLTGAYTLEVDAMNTTSSNGYRDFTVFFDYQDEKNHYYVNFTESPSANGIYKYVNGELTKFSTMPFSNVPGAVQHIKIVRNGSMFEVYANGTLVGQENDSTFSGGQVGIGTLNDTAVFDNLIVR